MFTLIREMSFNSHNTELPFAEDKGCDFCQMSIKKTIHQIVTKLKCTQMLNFKVIIELVLRFANPKQFIRFVTISQLAMNQRGCVNFKFILFYFISFSVGCHVAQ